MLSLLYRAGDALRHRYRLKSEPVHLVNGRRGEDLAHRHLRRRGLTIVARNYRPRSGTGEVDLIGWDGDLLGIVEVKTRLSTEFGSPDRAVDQEKQRSLERVAREYTRRAGIPWNRVRFDIVNVVLTEPPDIQWMRDAFSLSRRI